MSNATAQTIERLANRVVELEKALAQIVNGDLLDDHMNHNDNGLAMLIHRSNDEYIKKELKLLNKIALNAIFSRIG